MSKGDIRRHRRVPYVGPVRISWEDAHGPRYAQARCLDVSEGGLRIEVPGPIPVHSRISLRADRINLVGFATVKHVARHGSKYVIGLSLNQDLREQSMSLIREPESAGAVRAPLSTALEQAERASAGKLTP